MRIFSLNLTGKKNNMVKKSFAAANLAAFAVNSYKYNRIYVKTSSMLMKI